MVDSREPSSLHDDVSQSTLVPSAQSTAAATKENTAMDERRRFRKSYGLWALSYESDS
jgi:hypothetical protein